MWQAAEVVFKPTPAIPCLSGCSSSSTDSVACGADRAEKVEQSDFDHDIALAFHLQQEYDSEVAEKEERSRFKCPLCLETFSFGRCVQLDCSHRFCKDCLFRFFEIKIREKCVDTSELLCPMPNCRCEVTVPQVEGLTRETPLWERFLAARAELWRPSGEGDERLCICPTPDCMRFVVPHDLEYANCPKCRIKFCPKCSCLHVGRTCEEHAVWRSQNDAAEREFQDLLRRQGWQRCSCCGAPCEKQQGCNFMTCASECCRGRRHFCYLCGQELAAIQHFMHFPEGAMVNMCDNVDRRGDDGLPRNVQCAVMLGLHRIGNRIHRLLAVTEEEFHL